MSTNVSKEKREDLLDKIRQIRSFIAAAPQDENTGMRIIPTSKRISKLHQPGAGRSVVEWFSPSVGYSPHSIRPLITRQYPVYSSASLSNVLLFPLE